MYKSFFSTYEVKRLWLLLLMLLLLRHIIMTAMATTFPVSESGSLVMSGLPASLSATRTSTRRSRRGALNDGGCHPPSEARPWRPEISATALQIIAGEIIRWLRHAEVGVLM